MTLGGDISRYDCGLTAVEQGLALKLYDILCAEVVNGEVGVQTGEELRAQRASEIAIVNDRLMAGPRDSRWDFEAFPEDSFVIIDCQKASGGICVVNDWQGNYVEVTSFKPGEGYLRDEIVYRTDFAAELFQRDDEPAPPPVGPFNEDVMGAMMLIRQSRAIFDHPETARKTAEIVRSVFRVFVDILLLPFRLFLSN